MFVDQVKLKLIAGKGGNGCVAWRREKYIPKGGPSGGDGGKGADIVITSTTGESSLEKFRFCKVLKADNGGQGGPNKRKGKNGKKMVIKVPLGTLVKDLHTGEILFDFTQENQSYIVCQGGVGGFGNERFKTSTRQAPNFCTPGKIGEEREIELELKLIADVGLVGFPNAGKSTLVSAVTNVSVKIAPYPFTTLRPNLGYIQFEDYSRILIADIPGIIRNASQNRGLGLEFLKHIERTEVLVFVLDMSGVDGRAPWDDFYILREELKQYKKGSLEKPFVIALNKLDTEEGKENLERCLEELKEFKEQIFEISALENNGLESLLEKTRVLAQANGKRFY